MGFFLCYEPVSGCSDLVPAPMEVQQWPVWELGETEGTLCATSTSRAATPTAASRGLWRATSRGDASGDARTSRCCARRARPRSSCGTPRHRWSSPWTSKGALRAPSPSSPAAATTPISSPTSAHWPRSLPPAISCELSVGLMLLMKLVLSIRLGILMLRHTRVVTAKSVQKLE